MSLSHAKSRATLLSPLDWGRQRRSTQTWQRNMVASSQCALGPGARGAVLTGRGAHPSRAGEPRLPRAGTLTPDGRTCRALSPFPRGFLLQVTGLHAAPPHPEGVYLLQVNSRAHRSTPSAGRGSGCQPPALWLSLPSQCWPVSLAILNRFCSISSPSFDFALPVRSQRGWGEVEV